MKLSQDGLAFVAKWEGFRTNPYNDAAGNATIGYGHLLHRGRVTAGDHARWDRTTEKSARLILAQDTLSAETAMSKVVKVPISQPQFDALVSLAFNVGNSAVATSTLIRVLNSGNYGDAGKQFLRWNRAGGEIVAGLVNRRRQESKIFLQADKVRRWQLRLEAIRDAADHPPGWTLSRRVRARILKSLIAARS